jgi:hypothetical protein
LQRQTRTIVLLLVVALRLALLGHRSEIGALTSPVMYTPSKHEASKPLSLGLSAPTTRFIAFTSW